MNCTENLREKNYYKDRIAELVGKIENPWILEVILRFVEGMIKEG